MEENLFVRRGSYPDAKGVFNMNEFLERLTAFRTELKASDTVKKRRGWAWNDCNRAFTEKKNGNEALAKELFMFLASWGMLRNSFLMSYNWRILIPVVEVLLKDRFAVLQNTDTATIEKNVDLLIELREELYKTLNTMRDGYGNNITDTLISKIMMSSLGCIVAYDRFVRNGLAAEGMRHSFGKGSVLELCAFYNSHPELEQERKKIKEEDGIDYPPMKILDIVFWSLNEE